MSATPENPPAFPEVCDEWNRDSERYQIKSYGGMTLRDWFAGQALAGMIASPYPPTNEHGAISTDTGYANTAYLWADAMLAARTKGTP